MSSLQTIEVYQKAYRSRPTFRPTDISSNDVSEVTGNEKDVFILKAPGAVQQPAAEAQVITGHVDSERWCGDQRTKYAVLKVEGISFAVAVCGAIALLLLSM